MARGASARRCARAGIGDEDAADAREIAPAAAWEAALRFAQRRRIGPFAEAEADRAGARKGARRDASRRPSARRLRDASSHARPGEIPDVDSDMNSTWFTNVEIMVA